VQTREKKGIINLLEKQYHEFIRNDREAITTHILQKTLREKKRWENAQTFRGIVPIENQ
jgi:hypothetical protein